MDNITFDTIADAWKRMISDPDRLDGLKTEAPGLTHPTAIRIKAVSDRDGTLVIRFYGFEAAMDETKSIPIVKRMILNWVKEISSMVQVVDSGSSDLNLRVSTRSKFTEVAVPIYRRNSKTNKITRVSKCVGGAKAGRKVSDPNSCMTYPDVQKKINLSVSRRARAGQIVDRKTKTKLTNIVSRVVRKVNQRLKKARGF
jgi:hypothetical protein